MNRLSLMQVARATDHSTSMHSTIPTMIDSKFESDPTGFAQSPTLASPIDDMFDDDDDKSISIFGATDTEDDADFADVDCDTSWIQEMEELSASYQSLPLAPISSKQRKLLESSSMSLPVTNVHSQKQSEDNRQRHLEPSYSQGDLDDSFILSLTQQEDQQITPTMQQVPPSNNSALLMQHTESNAENISVRNASDFSHEKLHVRPLAHSKDTSASTSSLANLVKSIKTTTATKTVSKLHKSESNINYNHIMKDLDFSGAPIVPLSISSSLPKQDRTARRTTSKDDKISAILSTALAVDEKQVVTNHDSNAAAKASEEARSRRKSASVKKVAVGMRRKKQSNSPTRNEQEKSRSTKDPATGSSHTTLVRKIRYVASGGPTTVRKAAVDAPVRRTTESAVALKPRKEGTAPAAAPRPRRVLRGEKPPSSTRLRSASAREVGSSVADNPEVAKRSVRRMPDTAATTTASARRRPANKTTVTRRSPKRGENARSPTRSPTRLNSMRRKSAVPVLTTAAEIKAPVSAGTAIPAPSGAGPVEKKAGKRPTQKSRPKSSAPEQATMSRRRSSVEVPLRKGSKGVNRRRSSSNVADAARLAAKAIASEEAAKKPRKKRPAAPKPLPTMAEAARLAASLVVEEEKAAVKTRSKPNPTLSPSRKKVLVEGSAGPSSLKISPLRSSSPAIRASSDAQSIRRNSPLRKNSPVPANGPMKLSAKLAMAPVVRSEARSVCSRKSLSPKPQRAMDDSVRSIDSWQGRIKNSLKLNTLADEGSVCPSVTSAIQAGTTEDDTAPKPPVRRCSLLRSTSWTGRVPTV